MAAPTAASVSSAFRSLMGTVTSTANSVSSLVNVAGEGISMLDAFVAKAAEEQRAAHDVERHVFLNNLVDTAASEQAAIDIRTAEFCAKSELHAERYKTHHTTFSSILDKYRDASLKATEAQ